MIKRGGLAALFLCILTTTLSAHEIEVMYDRQDAVKVAVHYKKMTTIAFWDVVANVSTTIPATTLDIRKDELFPHTITLSNLKKKTTGTVYVTLASGVVVHIDIRYWGRITQKVIVKDARTEAQKAVQQAKAKTGMTIDERTLRTLWAVQWGLKTDTSVQVTKQSQLLNRNDHREVVLTTRYQTVGFTGFTQSIHNRSSEPIQIHPATVTTDCDLFSVSVEGAYTVQPGQRAVVHIVCKGATHATFR